MKDTEEAVTNRGHGIEGLRGGVRGGQPGNHLQLLVS